MLKIFNLSFFSFFLFFFLVQHTEGRELFSRVIMDSGSPTARTFPAYSDPVFELQMNEFLDGTDCHRNGNVKATFDCLRSLDSLEIQKV